MTLRKVTKITEIVENVCTQTKPQQNSWNSLCPDLCRIWWYFYRFCFFLHRPVHL